VDVAAGIALGGLAHFAFVASSRITTPASATFGAPGLALFGAVAALFYAGLYGAYKLGVAPWTWAIG
jgi:hypothetical protein